MENEKDILIQEWITSLDKKLVKEILKHCSAKEFYNKCKEMYRVTNNPFYIKCLRKINLYYFFYSFYLKKREVKVYASSQKKIQEEVNAKSMELDKVLSKISEPFKSVYIMQYSFYNQTGEHYFSGGAERYVCDLANLIKQLGYTPILIQGGIEEDSQPWIKQHDNLTVVGVNSNPEIYYHIINNITSPKLTIYSGCVDWTQGKKGHTPSVLISHGITWDCPILDANIKKLKNFLNIADTLVSVDTNTISWFRSTFAKTVKTNGIQFEYIPNYVDLEKYSPNLNKDLSKPIKILFPRRCTDERGFWLFADIIPQLFSNFQNIEIELVGFAHTDEIKARIETLSSQYPNKIKHYVCNAEEMNDVYRNADITLIPTLNSEGTSLSCIEAMASGNAVISTNIGGLTNLIINGYNGLLINPEHDSLYKAIEKLILNRDLRELLANNAINVAQVFSKQNWVASWENLLNRIFDNAFYSEILYSPKTDQDLYIYLTSMSYSSLMKQRPQHLLNEISKLGYKVLWFSPEHNSLSTKINDNFYLLNDRCLNVLNNCKFNKIINIYSHHLLTSEQQQFLNDNINCKIIIEHIDDFEIHKNKKEKNRLKKNFKRLSKLKNVHFVTSADSLYAEIQKNNVPESRILASPNAVNLEDFLTENVIIPKSMLDVKSKNKPIIGYYGALCDDWFDYDLCENLIANSPDLEFVFIGPVSGFGIKRLLKFNNFTHIPQVDYKDIPSYAKSFTVGIIPFKINDITKSTSPVKLYEYLALNLPIVTTPMPECKKIKFVEIANNTTEFKNKIYNSINESSVNQKEIEDFLSHNTWAARAIDIKNIINKE